MGLLNWFERNKSDQNMKMDNNLQTTKLPSNVTYIQMRDGSLQVDFYDMNASFKDFYDTTRLIINGQPINIRGYQVYNCKVSWYGQDDCQYLDKQTGELNSPRARDYRDLLAQIDINLLQSDPNYCNMVMKGLLNQKRVEKYLERGLQEMPEQPCGQYIGGVRQKGNGYEKFFSIPVGKASHNSTLMVNRRQRQRDIEKTTRQKAITYKKSKIKKLQREVEDMEEREL